ncbi:MULTISPECIES: PLP-dependent aminotransferase family protein [unclassified Bacillus (in: firmicutes)]|uniref:MocR-like pyridoxine biosynthesis transcription factor PdxR n=1 Tax=unclassified Bacillus (in: firmicutes) TaxID=185979 RepID=UPI0008DFF188|nr:MULTISPECIES: PLP-dependent aminotransferase family protein [unclassified Bacillus (in: firmicutes)]SFA88832.1 GntR family transcriptional regulator / MocR family aminotransferase [Bacillus sp. UNCCL13]SFQ84709.1 GntR family transcriptional regulator / MocR family aminotransferase [Bacillus sp. cl95]
MDIIPLIDRQHSLPIYNQLYLYFRNQIELGNLGAGGKLPSIRQLATSLNISRNTVEIAYQQLLAEGYIESKPKSGFIVTDLEGHDLKPKKIKTEVKIVKENLSSEMIDFQYGDIDLDKFPHKQWKKCVNEVLTDYKQSTFSYGNKKGHEGLRMEIADYLFRSRGVQCSHEDIILCAGTQSSMTMIGQLLDLRGKRIAFENPGYDGVRNIFQNFGSDIYPVSLDDDGINMEVLEKSDAKVCYVTPSHQFPLGMILPITKRMRLLQWALETDSYIIEDDYDSEFRYQGQPVPSLKSLDTNSRVIYAGTFSKAFLPAARMSYVVLPSELTKKHEQYLSHHNQAVSPIIQEAIFHFMQKGYFDRHIRKMRKVYHDKHDILIKSIHKYFDSNVKVIGQKAGLHLLLEFPHLNYKEFSKQARRKNVIIYNTDKFWMKTETNNMIMLGFGGLSLEEIESGIKALAQSWNDLQYKNN